MYAHEQLVIDSVGSPKKIILAETETPTPIKDPLLEAERTHQRRKELQDQGYYANADLILIDGVSKVISRKNEPEEPGPVTE